MLSYQPDHHHRHCNHPHRHISVVMIAHPNYYVFMNCLCLIWALGECWEHGQCIQSQYFEEQSNSCNLMIHLITHSVEKSTNATNLTMHPLGQAI